MIDLVSVNKKVYVVTIETDSRSGSYTAKCPVLRNCVSQGKTKGQAIKMIEKTIAKHLRR